MFDFSKVQENRTKQIFNGIKFLVDIPKGLVCFCLILYKICISPYIGPSCRFYPSCADYALQAFKKHGFFYGSYLSVYRLLRCNPLNPGGYDPCP